MPPRFFKTAREFEKWLASNHANADAIVVGFYKVGSGIPSITHPEALDAALAYGWIDGVCRRIDAEAYSIRFTPRRKGSYWSAINTKRAKELIKLRRMKPAGLAAFKARDTAKTRRYSYQREHARLDARLMKTLRADRKAFTFFTALPPGMKKLLTHWITSAKHQETRARRLALLMERSRAGRRIDLLRPRSE